MDPYAGMTPEEVQLARAKSEKEIKAAEDAIQNRRERSLRRALDRSPKTGRKKRKAFRP
ncbi:MAG: hypothetical protein VX228_13375 [Pseudomonadota bacterium]|nr:hypothetical protein [Pseudomonadota bacterium]